MMFLYGILAVLFPSMFAVGWTYHKQVLINKAAKRLMDRHNEIEDNKLRAKHDSYHKLFLEEDDDMEDWDYDEDTLGWIKMNSKREPISLKKLPSPEDVIYDMVMAHEGKVTIHIDTFHFSYSIKKKNETIRFIKTGLSDENAHYGISFSFANELNFSDEDLKTMYKHLEKRFEIWSEQEKERKRLEEIAKDAHRLDALIGNTKVAKVKRV